MKRTVAIIIMLLVSSHGFALFGGENVSSDNDLNKSVMMLIHNDSAGCGAAIIGPKALLTAAHCVIKESSITLFNNGALRYRADRSDFFNGRGIFVSAKHIFIHPEYLKNTKNEDVDLALIVLLQPLKGMIPFEMADDKTQKTFQDFQFLGYGEGVYNMPAEPLVLRTASFQKKSEIDNFLFDIDQVSTKKGICRGDSGGPAFTIAPDGRRLLLGLAVYANAVQGQKVCTYSGAFLRVGPYQDWIRQTLMENQ